MPTTIQIPKEILEEILEAGHRFVAAEDALEDTLLAADPRFVKKMRRLRREHLHNLTGNWHTLKTRYGL